MSDELTLEEIDRDGALLEAMAEVHGSSRAAFLAKATLGSAALLGALAAPARAANAAGRPAIDTAILDFDLRFEYLQSSFYDEAERLGTIRRMTPEQRTWAETLGAHERAHVRILQDAIGHDIPKKAFYDFHGITERPDAFIKTAVAMEDLTVALLSGQGPQIKERGLVAALFSLLTVEARHAAWARHIAGFVPTVHAFDRPKSTRQVAAVVASTHFVAQAPRMTAKKKPRFTG
jgi:hypothetical protein